MKKFVARLCIFVFAFAFSACAEQTDKRQSKPNILLIVSDDLGWGDVGYNGSEIRTPAIDALAAEGVRLERHYVYPVCSPTRAALLSGQSALAMGVDGPVADDAGLPLSVPLISEKLQDAGYQTFLVGKWHLGLHDVRYFPQSRGFEYFYGHLGGFIEYHSHLYYDRLDWQRNGASVEDDGHATELLAADAARVLKERDKSKPFFLYLALNAPHTPVQPPDSFKDKYAHIEDPLRADYARLVGSMDEAIGEVVDALRAEGVFDDTLIIYTSDNGGNAKEGGASNLPLRGGKGGVFEGGVRVPSFVLWANGLEGGRVYEAPFSVHDWAPTLASVAGFDLGDGGALSGVDQWPGLTGRAPVNRPDFVLGSRRGTAYFRWPWKLVQAGGPDQQDAEPMLFNLQDDPYEERNLAGKRPDLLSELGAALRQIPRGPSIADRKPPPERLWRNEDGELDYYLRENVKPTEPPWAESATGAEGFQEDVQ